MACSILPRPTADDVKRVAEEFDEKYGPTEWVLTQLFQKFPENTDSREVIVKTKVLNALYSTNVLAVDAVARRITDLRIDPDLKAGNPEIVDKISKVQLKGGKTRNFFCFASKYCSWHNPTEYPIYDKNVDACLWHYREQDNFDKFPRIPGCPLNSPPYGYDYPEFKRRVNAFRDSYDGLSSVSYRQLDKFLWSLGDTLLSRAKA
jgi:hypothetical protein